MKRKNLIFLFMAFFGLSFTQSNRHLVKYVYDGDTVLMDTQEKLRYLGIDAPEMGSRGKKNEFMAIESRDFNLRLVGQSWVKLEFDREKKDRHGRLLGYVFLENGDMVNALLVRKGLASVLIKRPNLKYLDLLIHNQRLAMEEKLGIWRKAIIKPENYYLGSSKSFRFHRPGCPFSRKILSHNLVRFKRYRDAFWEGFSPCKRCGP